MSQELLFEWMALYYPPLPLDEKTRSEIIARLRQKLTPEDLKFSYRDDLTSSLAELELSRDPPGTFWFYPPDESFPYPLLNMTIKTPSRYLPIEHVLLSSWPLDSTFILENLPDLAEDVASFAKEEFPSFYDFITTILDRTAGVQWPPYLFGLLTLIPVSPCVFSNSEPCSECLPPAPDENRCQAVCAQTGQRCGRFVIPGQVYCQQHYREVMSIVQYHPAPKVIVPEPIEIAPEHIQSAPHFHLPLLIQPNADYKDDDPLLPSLTLGQAQRHVGQASLDIKSSVEITNDYYFRHQMGKIMSFMSPQQLDITTLYLKGEDGHSLRLYRELTSARTRWRSSRLPTHTIWYNPYRLIFYDQDIPVGEFRLILDEFEHQRNMQYNGQELV